MNRTVPLPSLNQKLLFLALVLFLVWTNSRVGNYTYETTTLEEALQKSSSITDLYLAIIVAVRDREDHIVQFIRAITIFLTKQESKFELFLIEQNDSLPFNRAALFNVGVLEAVQVSNFSCFIFHDVDHIPTSAWNNYTCDPAGPVHFASASQKFGFSVPYQDFFGAVVGFSREQFYHIGGFSNCYWGWGGEDDDMRARAVNHGLVIVRRPEAFGRYSTLPHDQSKPNDKRFELVSRWQNRSEVDGVDNTRYTILRKEKVGTHTRITVNLTDLADKSYCS